MYKSNSTEFEFIERSSSNSIVKMWVLLEGSPSPIKLRTDITEVPDLNDFKQILKKEFEELENVRPQNIIFLDMNNNSILPGTDLQILANSKTDKDPLVVRYTLSNLSIKVTFKFTVNKGTNKADCHVEHTSNLFSVLQESVKEEFNEKLDNIPAKNINFEYYDGKVLKEKIKNEFQMNVLVRNKMKKMQDGDEEVIIDYLKILIKDQKCYSDWKIDEVLTDIYRRETSMPEVEIQHLDMDSLDLPESCPQLSVEELNGMVEQLRMRKNVFKDVNNNEATAREYISVILIYAVNFIIKNHDKSATLKAEVNLMGTHGYGPLDYAVLLQAFYILITEAKSNQTIRKGIAQNLAQISSAAELLGKRKISQTDFGTVPMIGIVTNGKTWVFIRQTGPIESAKLEQSDEFDCGFIGDMETEKKVVSYIVRLLQAQIETLSRVEKQRELKRSCIVEG